MTKDKQREALARLEFGDKFVRIVGIYEVWHITSGGQVVSIRDYLDPTEGHGHLQRLIGGLSEEELIQYNQKLRVILCRDLENRDGAYCRDYKLHLATPAQKAEAVLRAKGLWDD